MIQTTLQVHYCFYSLSNDVLVMDTVLIYMLRRSGQTTPKRTANGATVSTTSRPLLLTPRPAKSRLVAPLKATLGRR